MIRRLMLLLSVAAFAVPAGKVFAQGAFPAPLPGQGMIANDPAFPPVNGSARASDPAFPPVNGAAPAAAVGGRPTSFPVTGAAPIAGGGFERPPGPSQGAEVTDQCMKAFFPCAPRRRGAAS